MSAAPAAPSAACLAAAALATVVKAERARARETGGHVIFAHAGDTLSPSLMSGIDKGQHIVTLTNMVPPDIFAPGNHEFDFGKDIYLQRMAEARFPVYAANIRDAEGKALPKAKGIAEYQPLLGGLEAGVVALYQKCPHLGCRVPECKSSQWFECPCHGSQYNRVGEKKGGPAPRGMDHFAVTVSASGDVVVDTSTVFAGAAIGTNTTGQEAEGPHCITGGGGHG